MFLITDDFLSQMMYESMKDRVELVLERGKIEHGYVDSDQERQILDKWTDHNFTQQSHPSVIQVCSQLSSSTIIYS